MCIRDSYTSQGVSLDYTGTGECSWLNQNCYQYGFVVRFPEDKEELTGIDYEPWHFRYVGIPHAYMMTKNNLCLEEYISFLKQYPCLLYTSNPLSMGEYR